MNHTNLFHPYDRKVAHHEDNLTRAFLAVLRAVPVAHAAWLDLVDRSHIQNYGNGVPKLHELPAATFMTQTATLGDPVERVFSVLHTDENYFTKKDVERSDRNQVLDGVVSYAPELALVIENKPSSKNVWDGQLNVNVPETVEHDPRHACVKWRSIVRAWSDLLQAGRLSPAERVFIEDFLEFVEEFFPHLQPFHTLAACGTDEYRLRRRCRRILEAIAPGTVKDIAGWSYIDIPADVVALRIALNPVLPQNLKLSVYPGDTLRQAKKLYADFRLEDLQTKLASPWRIVLV